MKHFISLVLLWSLAACTTQALAQRVFPDVVGNVSVSEDYLGPVNAPFAATDDFTVFPGWPIQVTGYGSEGGIYCNMDADADLEIVYYLGQTIYALNLDGSYVPGWPQTTSYYGSWAPALGDIDGDGQPEIVVNSTYTMTSGMIHAYELDGSIVSGFPINHGYSSRTPVLADLDDDGAMEIITNKRFWPLGEWWVYRGDGTVYPGWPQSIDHVPSSSSAVGDITGDGIPEIVGESYDALYVWDINGNVLPGFPFMMPYGAVNSYSSPVLADLDGDGLREIVFGTHVLTGGGYVFALNNDGTQLPNWPKYTYSWIYGPPAVGYVDGDNILDVVVGDQTLSMSPMNFVYGWNANGTVLSGFPIGPIWAINNQVALADLDGDGQIELLFDDNTTDATGHGKYLAYNNNGTPLAGFPLITVGTTFFNMPSLTDFNNDGFLDLLGAGNSASGNWTDLYIWGSDVAYNPDNVVIPCFQYNLQHDGVFPGQAVTPPELLVTLTPHDPPIVIPPEGGSFDCTVEIQNVGTSSATFDGWIEAVLPNGTVFGPIILRENITLAVGGALTRDLTQTVPGGAPAGTYIYRCNVGQHPSTIYASDGFEFSKSGLDGGSAPSEWHLSGWGGEEANGASRSQMPDNYALTGNYPNPFNPTTTIGFDLPQAGWVRLEVFDVAGRSVGARHASPLQGGGSTSALRLVDGQLGAGPHQVTFDGSRLPSGVYIARLTAGEYVAVQKMVLMK